MGQVDQEKPPPGALEPIAICGLSMRLPGAVRGAEAFWRALVEQRELKCVVPEDRFNVKAFFSPQGKPGTIISPEAFYLSDAELGHLDTSMIPIAAHELRHIDPQQRMLLEITRECLENAGETNWRGKRVGCYVGTFGEDWIDIGAKDTLDASMYRAAGSSDFALSNRLSYEYDFRGPSMTIKTGCSAAMMGLNEACWAINSRQCDAAIVAGSNLILSPTMTISMGAAALSPTGSCKTFDANADGYARGEAVNAIYIKRLSDALADGNAVRAVIRGIGVNSDGQTSRTLTPSLVCQENLIRQVYTQAGLPFHKTAFFECHGTGTRVGDPIETGAVDNIFGNAGIHIGAVKPNFGHSEGASAITSIIKAVLSLEKRLIPPNMRFVNPNPAINWGEGRLMVPTAVTAWPEDRADRVSVNSFGIGGANGHVILESARMWTTSTPVESVEPLAGPTHLLLLSAAHEKSLADLKKSYESMLLKRPLVLHNIAHTLSARRQHHQYRTFCVATEQSDNVSFYSTARASKRSQLVFVFSGQGNLYPGVARELVQANMIFRKTLRRLDDVLDNLPSCAFSMQEELAREKEASRVQEAIISQPLSTALQICLCNALEAVGVRPDVVLGHSSGEIAAAYAAGALTETEAIKAAFFRGQAIHADSSHGAMLSVGLGRDVVEKLPLHGATLACDNSPSSVTLSGQSESIDAIEEKIEERYPNAHVKRLQVKKAYHSCHMNAAGQAYAQMLADHINPARPKIPFYSALLGRALHASEQLDVDYWRRHLESPVLFRTASEEIAFNIKQDFIFAEIGPHPTLTSSLLQTCAERRVSDVSHVFFLRRSTNATHSFLEALGRLYQFGASLDYQTLVPYGQTLTDLPNYPWKHDKILWNETRSSRAWRFREYPRHDLLGVRTGESSGIEPAWRNVLRLDDVGWISHHQVGPDVVLPFTAYCAMAGEAIQQVNSARGPFTLRRVRVGAALTIKQSDAVEVITTLRPVRLTDMVDSAWFEFTVSSFDGSQWIKHCDGSVRPEAGSRPNDKWQTNSLARTVEVEEWYHALSSVGLNYSSEFRRLRAVTADVEELKAAATIKHNRSLTDSHYQLHPATLDSAVQLIGVAASRGLARNVQHLFVPVAVEEMYINDSDKVLTARAEAMVNARGIVTGDVWAQSGTDFSLHVKGLTLYPLEGMERSADAHAAAELAWAPDLSISCGPAAFEHSRSILPESAKTIRVLRDTLSSLAHVNPLCSVLELSTGNNDISQAILQALKDPFAKKRCSSHTVTYKDENTPLLAEHEADEVVSTKHTAFDLFQGVALQEISFQSHDLTVVSDIALLMQHDPHKALKILSQVLRPGGTLVVHGDLSICSDPVKLEDAMAQAGFINTKKQDDSTLIAMTPITHSISISAAVTILCKFKDGSELDGLRALFLRNGVHTNVATLDKLARSPRPEHVVISLIDHQGGPVLSDMTQEIWSLLKTVLQSQSLAILWLTKPEPSYSMIQGFARTVRTESQLPFCTLESSSMPEAGAQDAVWRVFCKFSDFVQNDEHHRGAKPDTLDPDFEYRYRDGKIEVPRFRWRSLKNELLGNTSGTQEIEEVDANVHRPKPSARLRIGTVGRLDSVRWENRTPGPLLNDYVEIEIKAVGVNFKDVLVGLGIVSATDNALGIEGAGVITQVGKDVDHLSVGDRVMFCGRDTFANSIRGPAYLCAEIPDEMGFREAATMPCVFLTVIYALTDLGRLSRNDSILIHSACGGVGLAAIQLANLLGAEIFVTVGNEEKADHLIQSCGIPRNHIFSSRNTSFLAQLMHQTGGRGVDVVLNSLSGELLHASWRCVARFGRMIEIGKRDLLGRGKLDMDLFEANRTYVGLSLEEILADRPKVTKRLFSQLVDMLKKGLIKHISPITAFEPTAAEECLSYMQKGQHIGKIVMDIPENVHKLGVNVGRKQVNISPDASYLLVGGLGGLGRAIARWMVEHGAKHLILFSRTAGSKPEHTLFLDEMRAMGAVCRTIAGDVTRRADVKAAIDAAVMPIKGVMQATMVLKDKAFVDMSFDEWAEAVEPKVRGTWNLHDALLGADLDFFVILGSLSGIVGQHGQANYNAANAFANAFVPYRHSLSLAGSIVNLSAVRDIGILSRQPLLLAGLQKAGAHLLSEREVLDAVHWAILNSKPWLLKSVSSIHSREPGCLSLGLRSGIPLADLDEQHPWKRDRRTIMYQLSSYATASDALPKSEAAQSASARLLETVQRIHADPEKELSDPATAIVLAEEIGKKAFSMLLKPDEEVNIQTPLLSVGLDSLMAMQLRQWWREVFRVEVNVMQVANAKTFEGLGQLAVASLRKRLINIE
ncbi:unnamed protein product [Cercospora beticola]|nr:unnamed protein product [Cercospora beticola]